MELRQLRYFLTVARCGSFSKASAMLEVEQPALSRSLKALERELGVQLLHRHGRGVRLTERGQEFRALVLPFVQRLESAGPVLMGKAGAVRGPVVLGLSPAIDSAIGLALVRGFGTEFPAATLQVVAAYSGFLRDWLTSGRLDIAVLDSAAAGPGLSVTPLCRSELLHVVHRDLWHPSTWSDADITLEQALRKPLVLPSRQHGLRRRLAAKARELGIDLAPLAELDTLELTKRAVHDGLAATILPYAAVLPETSHHELIVRHVVEPKLEAEYVLAFAPDRPVTPAMRALTRTIRHETRRASVEGVLSSRR